jgi:hypothetical protein
MPARPSVIMLDAAERLQPVERWLREEFLPALPAETLVIIAGARTDYHRTGAPGSPTGRASGGVGTVGLVV